MVRRSIRIIGSSDSAEGSERGALSARNIEYLMHQLAFEPPGILVTRGEPLFGQIMRQCRTIGPL